MRRKYENDLAQWLKDEKRKPLLVLGARQVGKTYLINDLFAMTYFPKSNIYIDLSDDKQIREVIANGSSEQVLEYISRRWRMKLGRDTLLIFDEAQTCLPIVSLMKPFHERHPEIPIIVTGSLVTLSLNREKGKGKKDPQERLYPVGKINTLRVTGLTFEEYLLNSNPALLEDISACYKGKVAVPAPTHLLAKDALKEYLSIGGMPEALDYYLREKDYLKSRKILGDIYNNYIGDMAFNQRKEADLLATVRIYENIITFLGRESKDFHPSMIEKGKRSRDFLSPLEWLNLSSCVYFSYKSKERVTSPLKKEGGTNFRLYFSDIGMFVHAADISGQEFLSDELDTLNGAFYENYVASEMASASLPLFYWKGKGEAEFEFLLQLHGSIIPLEVKKGRGVPRSLPKYDSFNKRKLCIKLMNGNLGYDGQKRVLTLPLYMAFLLFKDFRNKDFDLNWEP